jgi:hypothetical protein
MKTLHGTLIVAALTVTFSSVAAEGAPRHCSIRPPKGTSRDALTGLAKVSREDALKFAVDSLKTSAPVTPAESELEVEEGCLVWSFDLKVSGSKGIEEVQIDAGNGRVVSREHETARHEKKEKAAEAR